MTQTVQTPAYDRSRLTPGIVHIGLGNFHRAGSPGYFHFDPERLAAHAYERFDQHIFRVLKFPECHQPVRDDVILPVSPACGFFQDFLQRRSAYTEGYRHF